MPPRIRNAGISVKPGTVYLALNVEPTLYEPW